jgi:hypothetical protein
MKRTNSLTETFDAIADQYQSIREEDKVITAREAMAISLKDIEGGDSNNNNESHNSQLAKLPPPSLLEAAETTRPIRNTIRPERRPIPSSTTTISPPPPEAGLRRNQYLPPTPGAVAVDLRYHHHHHHHGVLQTQGSEGTIEIGDDDSERRQASSGRGVEEQQLQNIVNAVLVSEHSERMDQVLVSPRVVNNLATMIAGEPVDAVQVTHYRVCSLVALLLIVIVGLVAGLSMAFVGGDNGSSANQNQQSKVGGGTPTPAPLFVPTMVPSFQAGTTAKPSSSEEGLNLMPVTPTITTQRPDGATPMSVAPYLDDYFTDAPGDDDFTDDDG